MDLPEDTDLGIGGNLRPWQGPAVLHVDMDAFFASVEQLDHPEWRGKPVIVGGDADSRGVVAAASYEARRFGVRSAMPAARAAVLCPEAIWTRGHFSRYHELSEAVMTILRSHSPDVQPASIDEAYVDVTPGEHGEHPALLAARIRDEVDELGVTCSIGVASSKTVAKIASDVDKPHGLTVVMPGEEAEFLAPMPVGAMPGIGPVTARRLNGVGIHTLGHLAALDEVTAVQLLGSHGVSAARRARGIDARRVREREPVKSVSNERTFGEDIRERAEVEGALRGLTERVATRLRAKGLRGRTVHLKLRYGDFTTRTAQETLGVPSDDAPALLAAVSRLLGGLWSPGIGVRLLGVGVSGFDAPPRQLDLFGKEAEGDERRRAVARSVDAVRERFGADALRFGGRSASEDPREKYGPKGKRKRPEEG